MDRAFASGADEYITKPIQWPLLRQRVRIYLERKKYLLALQDSEERFRSVTNSTVMPLSQLTKMGVIVFWNKGSRKMCSAIELRR